MNMDSLTPAVIAAITASILAVLMERVPGFATWYQRLDSTQKQLTMGIMLILTAFGSILWGCQSSLGDCLSTADWKTWAFTVFATLVNQPVHQLTKKTGEDPEPAAPVREATIVRSRPPSPL